jgi:thioredoxin-related protein
MIAPLAALCLFLFAPGVPKGSDLFRPIDLDSALSAAKREQKIVLAVFDSPLSADSKRLDSTTLIEAKVRAWVDKKAVAVRFEVEKRPDLADKYRVHVLPTILFVSARGAEMDRLVGFQDGKTFCAEADAILAGSDALARAEKRLHGHETDPNVRIDYAGALFDRGMLAEASAEYLWCWDHGLESGPGFAPTRMDFLLREIQRLTRVYTPATDALDERAQKLFQRVVDCAADSQPEKREIEDFTAIDLILDRGDRTLAAYDRISDDEACGAVRRALVPFLEQALVDDKLYKEVADILGDPLSALEAALAAYTEDAKKLEKDKTVDADAILQPRLRKLRAETAVHFEALLGAGRPDDGDKLAQRFLEFDPHGDSYVAMIHAAIRAGLHGHALSLVRRAEDAKLTDAERGQVKRASAEILHPK